MSDSMNDLASRAGNMIDAFTGALMSAAEAAAEKLQLATEVAKVATRMEAFGSVLEAIEAQRSPILARLETAGPAMKRLLARQLDLLAAQEAALLEKCGVVEEPAKTRLPLRRASEKRPELAATLNGNGVHDDSQPTF